MNKHFISWTEWETHILDFFRFILIKLKEEPELPHMEADKISKNLNRKLALLCKKNIVSWRNEDQNRPELSVICGGRNQPRQEDKTPHSSEHKEPDLQVFAYTDYQNKIQRHYDIECKRLYKPPSGNCKYYVTDGIQRFMKREYSYGIDVESGLMIGYVQSAENQQLSDLINKNCKKASLPNIMLIGKWEINGVSEFAQSLTRIEMNPSNFNLHHFWIDLRDKY